MALPSLGERVSVTVEGPNGEDISVEGRVSRNYHDAIVVDLENAPLPSVFIPEEAWEAGDGEVLAPHLRVVDEGGYL